MKIYGALVNHKKWIRFALMSLTVFLLHACSGSEAPIITLPAPIVGCPECPPTIPLVTDQFKQNDYNNDLFVQNGDGKQVDIVFVVDNSHSMSQEQYAIVAAAQSAVDAIHNVFNTADVRLAAITTNAAGSSVNLSVPAYANLSPTLGEINREGECADINDPRYLLSGCLNDWLTNGTMGRVRGAFDTISIQAPYVTGLEQNAGEIFTSILHAGLAGHWFESPIWAMSQFIRETTNDLFVKRPGAFANFVILTDTEDASEEHCGPESLSGCHLYDSRPIPDPNTNNPENPGWYEDPTTNFYDLLMSYKADAALIGLDYIGPLTSIPVNDPASCVVEDSDGDTTRVKSILDKMNFEHNSGNIVGHICNLSNYTSIMSNVANKIISQLNKQFALTPDYQYDEIVASSLEVKVNNNVVTNYNFIPAQLLIIFNTAPALNDQVTGKIFGSKLKYHLSQAAQPNTIVVSKVDANGDETLMNNSSWNYNATTNSVEFVSAGAAPQVSEVFRVRYNLLGAGEI